jgi:hypothetical protein
MGHKVDFNLINIDIRNTVDLYKFLKANDEKLKKNKLNSLLFQTLKSSIRKRTSQPKLKEPQTQDSFKENYKEKIKYYFENTPKKGSILKDIIDINRMNQKEIAIYKIIKKDLYNLVYNINSFDTKIEKEIKQNIEVNIKVNTDDRENKMNYKSALNSFHHFFNERIYLDSKFDLFNNLGIGISGNIHMLSNVFSLKGTDYYLDTLQTPHTYSDVLWYIFILYDNKLYLANTNILPYIYKKYPILNLNLNLINYDCDCANINVKMLKDLYNSSNFLKILNHKNTDRELLSGLLDIEQLLLINIFDTYDYKLMTDTQFYYYTLLRKVYVGEYMVSITDKIESQYQSIDDKYKLTITTIGGGNTTNDIWYDKYIKYKLKYNKLKLNK